MNAHHPIDGATDGFSAVEDKLTRKGRFGGCVMLVLAMGCGVLFLAALTLPVFFPGTFFGYRVALVLFLPAVFALVFAALGLKQLLRPQTQMVDTSAPRPMTPAELLTEVDMHAAPFSVCTRCMVIVEDSGVLGSCVHCDTASNYIPVQSDADKAMVRSSLAPGEPI